MTTIPLTQDATLSYDAEGEAWVDMPCRPDYSVNAAFLDCELSRLGLELDLYESELIEGGLLRVLAVPALT